MKRLKKYRQNGVGLVEVIVTIAILLALLAGSLGYQYYAALDARKSDLHITASRLALMFIETWKGQGSETDYDPLAELFNDKLVINTSSSGQPPAVLSELLGSYRVSEKNASFFITLSYQDQAEFPRLLNIVVAWWQRDYGEGTFADADKAISWSTYQSY